MAKSHSAAEVRWQDKARCVGSTYDFVPDKETSTELEAVQSEFCNRCPVQPECLSYALVYRQQGYWGGTSTGERALLSYPRNRVKCPVCKCKSLVTVDRHEICQSCASSWTRTSPEGTNT